MQVGSSRIEAFSDAVFGFALTLLVVSLEVPRTMDELMVVVRGFLPFAATFATIAWLWYEHYVFFRRFAPDDRVTITLNCALLFMVLFYVYPLKFLFTLVVNQLTGQPAFREAYTRAGDAERLMIVYGLGFVVVFVTFALLYVNVLARRAAMRLTPLQQLDAKVGVITHLSTAGVGVLSLAIVLIGGEEVAAFSGMCYALIGVVHGVIGFRYGPRRAQLHASTTLPV